jgi:hypothetical protein
VVVALRRRRLRCPKCSYSTRHRENRQDHESVWRHLDLEGCGGWRLARAWGGFAALSTGCSSRVFRSRATARGSPPILTISSRGL